ncbi:MAG: hypothetical protein LM590_05665 [Thermofilum sp.]|nr:hypothetical protein [Thermofilum sp.]
MPVYAAVKLGREPCECEPLHEPVGGWAWVRCPDLGALLREVARSLLSGFEPLVATPRGLLDPLEAEARLSELEDPVLDGEFLVLARGNPFELLELGATAVEWKPGDPTARARFRGARVARLLERGLIPIVWVGKESSSC